MTGTWMEEVKDSRQAAVSNVCKTQSKVAPSRNVPVKFGVQLHVFTDSTLDENGNISGLTLC
jgi:hypothetical protein